MQIVAEAAPNQRDELLLALVSLIEQNFRKTDTLVTLVNIPKDERVDTIIQTRSLLKNITFAHAHAHGSWEITSLLQTVGQIPQVQRAEVIAIAKSFVSGAQRVIEMNEFLDSITAMPRGQRKEVTAYVRQLLTGTNKSAYVINRLFEVIAEIPRGQRRDVCAHATSLLRGNESLNEKEELLRCLAAIPRGQRKAVIAHAAPLFRRDAAFSENILLLNAIAAIPRAERADVLAHFTALPTADMNAGAIRWLLRNIAAIPHGQRAEVIAQKMAALRPFEHIEGWRTLVSEIVGQPLANIPGIVNCTQSLAHGLTELEDIRSILRIVADRSMLSLNHQEDLAESVNRILPDLSQDMSAWARTLAFGQMHTEVQAERAPFGFMPNRAGIRDAYVLDCTRQQLEESPRSLLHDLCEQFKQQPRDRLRVHFQGEAGVDAGGLGRQFVTELSAGIGGKMGFKECENGLFRPELTRGTDGKAQPLSSDAIATYHDFGEFLEFCPNAAEDYPIGMLFDLSVFEALTMFEDRHLTDFKNLTFTEQFSIYEAMQHKEDDRQQIEKIKQWLEPLKRDTPENVLRDAYAAVETDDAIAALGINYDPEKIRKHYPAIQEAIKKSIVEESIWPVVAPLIEIAKGMKDAPFGAKLSWAAIHGMNPAVLSERLQGVVTREMILDKLQFGDGIAEEKQEWMKRWIENADDAKIKQFLFAMSGSSSLGRKPLSIEKSGDNIYFHTCFNTVDIPMDGIETDELFASLINTTIVGKEYSRA